MSGYTSRMTTTTEGSRGFYFLASVLGGIALGLAAYRFGVLPFGWAGKGSYLFPALFVGLGYAARAVIKDRGPRPALPLLVVGTLLGAGAGFGASYLAVPTLGNARLTTHALPGFAIGLPSGEAPAQKLFDYDVGKFQVKNLAGQGGVILVSWEGGEPLREDLEMAATALGPSMGATGVPTLTTVKGPRGTAVDTFRLEGDKSPFLMSVLPCGTRRVLVATMAGSDTEAVHARVLPTFVCKPDPARETVTNGVVPIVAELPGWYATERGPGQVVLNDGTGMVLLKTIPSSSTSGVEAMVVPMFNAVGMKLAITGRVGDRLLVSGTSEGQAVHGWVRSVTCGTQAVVVVAIAVDLAGADVLATQLQSMRCPRHAEAPTAWPDPPAAAEQPAAPSPAVP